MLLLVAVGAVIGAIVLASFGTREPSHAGRRLSYWLAAGVSGNQQPAEEAIRHIGAKALPSLLQDLRADDSTWRERIGAFLRKQPKLAWLRSQFLTPEDRRRQAYFGFNALGPLAKPAVPELIHQLRAPKARDRQSAASVLGLIALEAKEAVYPLITALKDENPAVQQTAVYALSSLGPGGKPAVPALLAMLRSEEDITWIKKLTQPAAATSAPGGYALHPIIYALGKIGPEAKEAVPELIEVLKAGEPFAQATAARSLAKIAPKSREAVLALQDAAVSQDGTVSSAATAALKEIASDPATRERLRFGGKVFETLKPKHSK